MMREGNKKQIERKCEQTERKERRRMRGRRKWRMTRVMLVPA